MIHAVSDASSRLSARRAVVFAVAASLGGCAPRQSPEPERPNVILLLVDTLRADRIGTYGYEAAKTPYLDAFAASSTVFEDVSAQSPHTIPSVLQIMTSRYRQGREIDPGSQTLARVLRNVGYRTVAIVDNPHFEHQRNAHGLVQGFDFFYRNAAFHFEDVEQQHWKTKTHGDVIAAQARRWLKKRPREEPFFMWLHFFDPHDPYAPPYSDEMNRLTWDSASQYTGDIRNTYLFRESRGGDPESFSEKDRRHISDLYDAEIAYLDEVLGELFAFLSAEGLWDETLILFGSDHGESLGERGRWFHGRSLYQSELGVPLIIKYPRQRQGSRNVFPVQAIDIFPTILDVLGVQPEQRLDGVSLLDPEPRRAFTFWRDRQVVREEQWKLLRRGDDTFLFDLNTDPDETWDMSSSRPDVVDRLLGAAAERLKSSETTTEELQILSDEALERMRAVGYIP